MKIGDGDPIKLQHQPEPYRLRFMLPGHLPSINTVLAWHWRKRHALYAGIHRSVGFIVGRQYRPAEPLTRAAVRFTVHSANEFDDDNLRGTCKPVLDALVSAALIQDDTPAVVTLYYDQQRVARRSAGVLVEVHGEPTTTTTDNATKAK